jgi:hypothetical protein
MFKLLKLAALGLLGYALYEFFRGVTTVAAREASQAGLGQGQQQGAGHERQEIQPGDSGNQGAGNMQFSGPGEGQRVQTEEASGTGVPHIVGRGVVHR